MTKCLQQQRLARTVDLSTRDRNAFAHKLAFQRKEPTSKQKDELKGYMAHVIDNNEALKQHEASCPDCIGVEP